jgi:hypothetical protein
MNKRIRTGLLLAGMQLAFAVFAVTGKKLGYWDSDTVARITMIGIGLMLLFTANFTSKAVARSARVIANQRLLGWSMMSGALIWTGSWLFAPMDYAVFVAMAAVALGTFGPIAYCLLTRPKTPA